MSNQGNTQQSQHVGTSSVGCSPLNICVDEMNNVDTWIEKEHNSQSSLSGMEEGRQQKSRQKRISKLMDIIPVAPGVVNRKYKVTVT